jgi:hypothetical protein
LTAGAASDAGHYRIWRFTTFDREVLEAMMLKKI